MRKDTVNMAITGLGVRGMMLLEELLTIPAVRIAAVCDIYEDRMRAGADRAAAAGQARPAVYTDYREMLAAGGLDGVVVACDWTAHMPVTRAALKAGVPVGLEVGGATSLFECFELVRLSEETGVPCMLLENCCYGREEMAVLHMIKLGVLGEIIHCACGYLHDLREEICLGRENRHYRLDNYLHRNGDNYPTHGIGPIAQYLGINRGNRFLSLSSVASKSRGLRNWAAAHLPADHPLQERTFNQADVVTTMIQCANGETVLCTLNTCLPRPYSRGGLVQGTKGIWMEEGRRLHLDGRGEADEWIPADQYLAEFDHPLWVEYQRQGVHEAGHDGMDYLCMCALVESIQEGIAPPIDVYDAATWMANTVLSEQSVALGGAPVAFPDFTGGEWIHRRPGPVSKYALDRICGELF